MKKSHKSPELLWADFKAAEKLSDQQIEQFEKYEAFLSQRNQEINLTAITDLAGILRNHFADSLMLRRFMDLSAINTMVDVGTGAGFPAIPLKIIFPHMQMILIEVTRKKLVFLEQLVELLGLDGIELYENDWRTFLRTTDYKVDLFVTRAAIQDRELCRAFKPGCLYKDTSLIYWASEEWQPDPSVADLVRRQETYKLGSKARKLVFFGLPKKS